jgi:Resolvase, N terminal domain.
MLDQLREGDVVTVWKLDRLVREKFDRNSESQHDAVVRK